MQLKKLIVIAGPTASGKTALSIELAKALNTVIISADARQFYRETSIGTAKASEQELAEVAHYFINNLSIHDNYDVGKYEAEVLALLDELFINHDKVILCGGSGLFIKAITEGLDELPVADQYIRNNIAALYETNGLQWLQNEIKLKDPVYFAQADIQNPKRLIRALEVIEQTGNPISSFHKKNPRKRNFESVKICLDIPRDLLYERINERVIKMFDNGLEKEGSALYPFRNLNALQTVGYTELFEYFEGKISLTRAIDLIQQHTRNYAKRQLTWFRKDGAYIWSKPDINEILQHC